MSLTIDYEALHTMKDTIIRRSGVITVSLTSSTFL